VHLTLSGPTNQLYPKLLHAAACSLFEGRGVDHYAQVKPFSVGPLRSDDGGVAWRLGWIGAGAPPVRVPTAVRFGDSVHSVVAHRIEPASHAKLSAVEPAWAAELNAVSPLYFSRNGRDYPLPDPELIVAGLIRKWNTFSPRAIGIDDELRDELLAAVILDEFDGRTEHTWVTYTQRQIGFLGSMRLALRRGSDRTLVLFAALMRFATVAGIGAQTTHGYGHVDLVELSGRRSSPTRTAAEYPDNGEARSMPAGRRNVAAMR